ncbi:MAG: universal stress protein [Nitrospira sp. LK70]|nr:universal stress protein [Nitrospira sp. LK70]
MTSNSFEGPVLQRIVHPSDFSEAGESAFVHALVAALTAKATLTILHVAGRRDDSWTDFPGVRETLERWGLLPKNSERADVSKLGIKVQKVQMVHSDPVESVTAYLEQQGTDLVVLATDQSKSGVQWLNKSVATGVARKSRVMTLFVPKGVEGFVSPNDGSISLKSILIPVAPVPSAQPAVHAVARLVTRLRCDSGLFTLLHVGEEGTMPELDCPEVAGWRWNRMTKSGEVIEAIQQAAGETDADLIVMTTDGRNGFLDALRGSHSERVLRESRCPVLAIPASGFMASVL